MFKLVMNSNEVCKMLNIHQNTLRNWENNGFPFHKVGKSRIKFYFEEEVIEFIKSRKNTSK